MTGLDYAWNRYYSSTWGRFTSADPYVMSGGLGNPQGWNRYSYVENDPVNFLDSSGLFKECPKGDGCKGDDGPAPGAGKGGGGPGETSDMEIVNDTLEDQGGGGIPNLDLSDRGLTCLKSYEGLSLKVYKDSAGNATIGYGHLILKGEDFSAGITETQAADLLRQDAAQAIKAVQDLVKVVLIQDQFDALVSFTFNLGQGNLAKSTLLSNINSGKTVTEANFADWNKAGGRVVDGLTARRKDEYSLFSTGTSSKCPK